MPTAIAVTSADLVIPPPDQQPSAAAVPQLPDVVVLPPPDAQSLDDALSDMSLLLEQREHVIVLHSSSLPAAHVQRLHTVRSVLESDRIAAYCAEHDILLLEDCAHAHGASWNGRRPGSWGDAGVYSLYATKTISTGEGGVLVTRHPELAEFARRYRDYGKPDHAAPGLNFRMSEFTAALGLVQVDRLAEIVRWKNQYARDVLDPRHPGRLRLPESPEEPPQLGTRPDA